MVKQTEIEEEDFKDLKPQNKRRRKEPPKPWGKLERIIVFLVLLVTVGSATILSLSARNWKLPNLPKLSFPKISTLNPFREQTVVVGNHATQIDQHKIEKIKTDFRNITDGYSGIYAFYIYDLNGDYFYGENYQESLTAASLIKLPVMELAFKELEAGSLKEEETLPLLEAMGKRSDNQAYLQMVDTLGKEEIQKEIDNLGMTNTSLKDNLTTPEDIGTFFKKLYNHELLSEEYTNLFFEYLTNTNFEEWLRKGVPTSIPLVHKYGRETHSVSDAGVVLDTKPFVLVIMTDGVVETEADYLFPQLANLLYTGHTLP